MRSIFALFIAISFNYGAPAVAIPVFIEAAAYPPILEKDKTRLVFLGAASPGAWSEIPFQIDELNEQRRKVMREALYPDTADAREQQAKDRILFAEDPESGRIGVANRFVVDDSGFAPCALPQCAIKIGEALAEVCKGPSSSWEVHRIALRRTSGSIFIALCDRKTPRAVLAPQVQVDLPARRLHSDLLDYRFALKNHMLVDEIRLAKSTDWTRFLGASDFRLYLRPKFFFPLSFGGDDVRSELLRYQVGPLGTSGDLTFYLSVLKLKIQLRLISQVSVFRDAIHVPLSITLPISGTSLRAGSGVYYGFAAPGGELRERLSGTLPWLGEGKAPFAAVRTLALRGKTHDVALGIHVPEAYRDDGLAPALATAKELAARDFPASEGQDFGVYFDVTGLRKGTYRLDLWFYLGAAGSAPELLKIAQDGNALETEVMKLH